MAPGDGDPSNLLDHISFFVPTIPDIPTTGRYSHAYELPDHAQHSQLLVLEEPPATVEKRYDEVHVIRKSGPLDHVRSAVEAKKIANRTIGRKSRDEIFVTTFHFAPVLAGYLSNAFWVVSVHDDVFQGIFNNPLSDSQITDRVANRLLKRADRRVYTIRPNTTPPNVVETRYVNNGLGCPIDLIGPSPDVNDVLQVVCVGKTGLEEGQRLLLESATELSPNDVQIDVYGEPDEAARNAASAHGVTDVVTYHGRQPHEVIREAIAESDVGLCVLPERPDWMHTATVKVREYLAGGAIPLVSNFPGLRQLAKDNAKYVEPTSTSLTRALEYLIDMPQSERRRIQERVRNHAESMPHTEGREWWAHQITGRVGLNYH